MDAETASDRVRSELVGIARITNWGGVELIADEIAVVRREYENAVPPARTPPLASAEEAEEVGRSITLWCVIDGGPSGLDVVFDEVTGKFGLASVNQGRRVFFGLYGTLLEAFRGM